MTKENPVVEKKRKVCAPCKASPVSVCSTYLLPPLPSLRVKIIHLVRNAQAAQAIRRRGTSVKPPEGSAICALAIHVSNPQPH